VQTAVAQAQLAPTQTVSSMAPDSLDKPAESPDTQAAALPDTQAATSPDTTAADSPDMQAVQSLTSVTDPSPPSEYSYQVFPPLQKKAYPGLPRGAFAVALSASMATQSCHAKASGTTTIQLFLASEHELEKPYKRVEKAPDRKSHSK
jgi:hypothetical protein